MFRTLFAGAGLAVAMGLAAIAQEASIGPAIGSEAPEAQVVTAGGEAVALSALSGERGTVIAFVRSLDWCPYCKQQAMDLEAAKAPLEEAGWTLVGLSYDAPEILSGFAEEKALTYTLVSDEGSDAIRAFGLLNEDMREGSRYWGIPHPAIVFVSADGTVAAVVREDGYKERPPVDVVLETARDLAGASAE
ncbi:peroxiredoxin family protein [Henriciella marina]|uniref:peroxiredoxin family protein n=1 Tax=Henriciella marina TaxID=453851 RepID=UPI000367B60E|nr:peroxiredoxin family protein [Henriciella marina]